MKLFIRNGICATYVSNSNNRIEPLEWGNMVLYHYGNKDRKKVLVENLKLCWEQARNQSLKCSNAYDAMEELFSEFGESSMRIIIFSMRNRKVSYEEGIEIGLDQVVNDSKLLGLKKCIKEWNSQADSQPKKDVATTKAMRRDSLTEVILSHEELRNKGEYMIAAIVQRVRRLRKATDQDLSKLSFSDSLLEQADKIWEREKDEIVGRENLLAAPNEKIDVAIEMQKLLNEARKATTQDSSRINMLNDELVEYLQSVGKGTAQHTWSQIYRWWVLRIKLRRAQKRLDFADAEKTDQDIRKLKKEIGGEHSEYLESLTQTQRKKQRGGDTKDPYSRLQEYHELVSKFMHNPTWGDNYRKEKRAHWDKESRKYPEKKRYLEYAAFPEGTRLRRWKVHQFTDPKYLSPIELVSKNGEIKKEEEYSKDWREDRRKNSLIQKCRVSISNSLLMTQNIIANNTHLAPATLILNAVDLMVKIRWFLATPKVHDMRVRGAKGHPWVRAKKDGESFRKDNEIRISIEIRDGLVLALSAINRELDIYEAKKAHEAVSEWVESLKDLPLETRKTGVGPLGQLCDHCGTLLGWEWKNPGGDRGRESDLYSEWDRIEKERKGLTRTKRVQTGQYRYDESEEKIKGREVEHDAKMAERNEIEEEIGKMRTCLLLKDSDGKELLRVDMADQNPYLKPVGEISTHQ